MAFISLNKFDVGNILQWLQELCDGKIDVEKLNDSEKRTYEKILSIKGLQEARFAVGRKDSNEN